jgi:hypothetical protein
LLYSSIYFFHVGLHLRQTQAQEKAENNEERKGKRLGIEEEGAEEKKRR